MVGSSEKVQDGSDTPKTRTRPVASKRHSKFYFDNTLVVIQIEDTLFNVHKYQLMKSETFSDMFKVAKPSDDEPEEGSSPENPIVMLGVAAADFECLLTVLYATHFSTHQPTPDASLIIPAFRLANKWNFEDLSTYLLPLAEKELSEVDKIVFAREFGIKAWLAPAHTKLCHRAQRLTTDEAVKLGVHSLLLISRLREEFRSPFSLGTRVCPPCAGYNYQSSGGNCSKCGVVISQLYRTAAVDTYAQIGPGAYVCCPCAGYTYFGATGTCSKCSRGGHTLTAEPNRTQIASIQPKVEQWVESGCVFSE